MNFIVSSMNKISLTYNYEHAVGAGYMRILLNDDYVWDGILTPDEWYFPATSDYRLRLGNAVPLSGSPSCEFKASYVILKESFGITTGTRKIIY